MDGPGHSDPPVPPGVDAVRLPFRFDPDELAVGVDVLPDDAWVPHFVPEHHRGDWSVVPLRAPAGETHPIRMISSPPGCEDFVETHWLEGLPGVRRALTELDLDLLATRLMRLGPDSEIHEHRDHDLDGTEAARLHVPVRTDPRVSFLLRGRRVELEAGSCWWLRLSEPHRVRNDGAGPRIHLVLDVRTDDRLRQLLAHESA